MRWTKCHNGCYFFPFCTMTDPVARAAAEQAALAKQQATRAAFDKQAADAQAAAAKAQAKANAAMHNAQREQMNADAMR